jgi:hypothetical protein
VNEFVSLEHARATLNTWREDYNHTRPHGSLGLQTPSEYANRGQKTDPDTVGGRSDAECWATSPRLSYPFVDAIGKRIVKRRWDGKMKK